MGKPCKYTHATIPVSFGGKDYVVAFDVLSPGSPGGRWEPPTGPEIAPCRVEEDKPGAEPIPPKDWPADLVEFLESDDVYEEAVDALAEQERAAWEDYQERRREDR